MRAFRARQHCHKVESKVDGGSRSLARDDPAKVHHPLINTLRARNFDARIARRRRPFHDSCNAARARRCTDRTDVFAAVVCRAHELQYALITFEVDITGVPPRKDHGVVRLDVVDRKVRHHLDAVTAFYRRRGYTRKDDRYARTTKDVNDGDRLDFLKPGGKKDNYIHRSLSGPVSYTHLRAHETGRN